jgi:hypothetical protein
LAAGGAGGSEAWLDGGLDGTLRPDDRRGKEVRRVEYPGPGRLEREIVSGDQLVKRQSTVVPYKGAACSLCLEPLARFVTGGAGARPCH